jgi:CRP-like cAMP-binding protein
LLEALGVRGGEVLLDQGQPVTTVYLLLAGEARILIHDGDSLRVVGTSRRGELLGEITPCSTQQTKVLALVSTQAKGWIFWRSISMIS